MAFSVSDFQDLLALLRQNPEWLVELRQLIIADDFQKIEAGLDRIREEMHESRKDFDERMRSFDARMQAFDERMKSFDERLVAIDQRLEALVNAQLSTELNLNRLNLEAGKSRGFRVQYHFRDNIAAYLGTRYDRGKRILISDLALARDAVRAGTIDRHEWQQLVMLDVLYRGFEPNGNGSRHEVIVPMEVSAVIDRHGVTRASDRADVLRKTGYDARPFVAGETIISDARELADQLKVEVLLAPLVDQI